MRRIRISKEEKVWIFKRHGAYFIARSFIQAALGIISPGQRRFGQQELKDLYEKNKSIEQLDKEWQDFVNEVSGKDNDRRK